MLITAVGWVRQDAVERQGTERLRVRGNGEIAGLTARNPHLTRSSGPSHRLTLRCHKEAGETSVICTQYLQAGILKKSLCCFAFSLYGCAKSVGISEKEHISPQAGLEPTGVDRAQCRDGSGARVSIQAPLWTFAPPRSQPSEPTTRAFDESTGQAHRHEHALSDFPDQ